MVSHYETRISNKRFNFFTWNYYFFIISIILKMIYPKLLIYHIEFISLVFEVQIWVFIFLNCFDNILIEKCIYDI